MSYRDRRLRKAAKLREWSEGRAKKAEALRDKTPDSVRHDWAFITQPGHIPERARMNRRDEKAAEHRAKSASMASRADGIEAAADRAIYMDDHDVSERLTAKLEQLETKRAKMKRINAAHKAYEKRGNSVRAKYPDLTDADWLRITEYKAQYTWEPHPFPPYALTNLGGTIRKEKKRLAEAERRAVETERTEAAGGILITEYGEYCAVQFSEKPDRETIQTLKSAGFSWGAGRWSGKLDALPADIKGAV